MDIMARRQHWLWALLLAALPACHAFTLSVPPVLVTPGRVPRAHTRIALRMQFEEGGLRCHALAPTRRSVLAASVLLVLPLRSDAMKGVKGAAKDGVTALSGADPADKAKLEDAANLIDALEDQISDPEQVPLLRAQTRVMRSWYARLQALRCEFHMHVVHSGAPH